jgi:amino acid adenylation domain-containing protein
MSDASQAGMPLVPVDFDPFAPLAADVLPLTEPQKEMWLAAQMGDEASCAFNQCFCLSLRGPLSVESMERALRRVADRHDALRATIDPDGEGQRIAAAATLTLPVLDLSQRAAQDRAAEVERILVAETTTPFDLASGPLLRARLVREAEDLHRLVVTVHHIICDGWSSAVLFGDLGVLYAADRRGTQAQLTPAVPYREYVAQEAERVASAQARADEEYWLQRYAKDVPVLDLPSDRPRPALKTFNGGRRELRIDGALWRALKAIGAKRGCTPYVTLLAAFEALISRLSGQGEFVVGVPMAGQAQLESGHLVGHCVNLVPLRCKVDLGSPFADHLAVARREFLDAQSHQQLTFGSLVRKLNVAWDPSRTPLVAVTFNIDRIGAPFDFGDLALERVESPPKRYVNFELVLNVVDDGREPLIECEYNADLFGGATIERWLGQFRTLLEAIVADPAARVEGLALLSEAERRRMLVEWNDTVLEVGGTRLMHAGFEAQAARTPQRAALRFGAGVVSYGQLEGRANGIARCLRARGVGRGRRVGICLERGPDMVAAVLGVLKAGAAYVPLDPMFPGERLRFMAEDAELALLVSTAPLAEACGVPRERQLLLDADDAAVTAQSVRRPEPDAALDARPEDPAYVIYTSGSTGKPKGVVVPHRAVASFLASMARTPGMVGDDVLLAVTTLSFDIAVLELQLPLTLGAEVVIASRDEAMDGFALRELLERSRATVMQATPITWRLLLEAGWQGGSGFKALVGGEALPKDLAEQLIARGVALWNMYGPTETTVWSTCTRVDTAAEGISIGRPIANTRVYVLDARMSPCPVGVAGELHIGGEGVALEYWRRPELTAERFVADPFASEPGARLYRTGDLARWRDDGMLEHLGRLDFQVKVRGFRIELGEIEANLASHAGVRECTVVAREDLPGDQRLVAYVVPRDGEAGTAELQQFLSLRLPAYMVPEEFVSLAALPRTPNGKVDRRALPAPQRSGAGEHADYVAPRSRTEEQVAASWRKALQHERVGVHDDFFELGGRSLAFVRMISEINGLFGIRLGMADLIGNPTVQQFAKLIDAQQPQAGRAAGKLSSLVQLQEGRAGALPVYFIYAGPGELRAAQHMGGSHAVYGIEARWPMAWRDAVFANQVSAFPSLEEMVAPYVAELSAHAGTSPCVVAGFCYAGRIAFEAAHQLQKLGGKVECVILIDTEARPQSHYKLAWQIWRGDWQQQPSGGPSAQAPTIQPSLGSRVKSTWRTSWWLLGKAGKVLRSRFKRPELDLSTLSGVLDENGVPLPWAILERLYIAMDKRYRLRKLDSRGVLFRTGEFEGKQIAYAADDALGWEDLFAHGVEVIPIPGHHFSIWGRQIPAIAREINRVLAAQTGQSASPSSHPIATLQANKTHGGQLSGYETKVGLTARYGKSRIASQGGVKGERFDVAARRGEE